MHYVFLGAELGGRVEDPQCYDDTGRILYERVAETGSFHAGVDRLVIGANKFKVAVMCTEKDPLDCHRFLLISRYMANRVGATVRHLHADGRVESQSEAEVRLRKLWDLSQADFFADDDQQLNRAYEFQSKKAAYRLSSIEDL